MGMDIWTTLLAVGYVIGGIAAFIYFDWLRTWRFWKFALLAIIAIVCLSALMAALPLDPPRDTGVL